MFIYIYILIYKMGNEINVKTTIYSNFKHKKHAHTKLSPLKKGNEIQTQHNTLYSQERPFELYESIFTIYMLLLCIYIYNRYGNIWV
jgi:hypothetical protein